MSEQLNVPNEDSNEGSSAELVVPSQSSYAVASIDSQELTDIVFANIDEGLSVFDLPRARVPAGGVSVWRIDTEDGEKNVDFFDGVIVDKQSARAYWEIHYEQSGGGSPPDCSSRDAKHGEGAYGPGSTGNPSGLCDDCPMSKFGSEIRKDGTPGRGQACKQIMLVFVIREHDLLPLVASLPPTSLKAIRAYLIRRASAGERFDQVVTRFALNSTKNADGVRFSILDVKKIANLGKDEYDRIRQYGAALSSALKTSDFDYSVVAEATATEVG